MAMSTSTADGDVMVEMNTTPLIDVMLVLLTLLINTLPIQTHAVKLDMPAANSPPPRRRGPPRPPRPPPPRPPPAPPPRAPPPPPPGCSKLESAPLYGIDALWQTLVILYCNNIGQ